MSPAFFTGQYRRVVALVESWDSPDRWPQLILTLSYAQLGGAAALDRWRTRFLESWPDYDYEAVLEQYLSPGAERERALWRESHLKAGLLCGTAPGASDAGAAPPSTCEQESTKATAKKS
jgi:hypothetical protein